jgi:hypothetical protein
VVSASADKEDIDKNVMVNVKTDRASRDLLIFPAPLWLISNRICALIQHRGHIASNVSTYQFGAVIVSTVEFETVPSAFTTATAYEFGYDERRQLTDIGTAAVSWFDETKVAGKSVEPILTCAPDVKLTPFTVSVNAE